MNFSSSGSNSTPVVVRDDLKTAIMKNMITVTLCVSINYVNATLVYTFMRHEFFKRNPRYILFIHLVINDIILMTVLTLIQVLSYVVYTLHVWLCMTLLIFALFSNFNNPMTLAVMAIECYVAVCFPLRHSQIITVKKTYITIALIWLISAQSFFPDVLVSLTTEHLDFFQSRVFCQNTTVFRIPGILLKNIIYNAVLMATVWLTLIYTYFKILFTAKSASSDATKARNTVLLHSFQLSLSMLTYMYTPLTTGLTYLFPQSVLAIRFAVIIIVSVMPRLVSPLVYGIRDKTFRKYLKKHLIFPMNFSGSGSNSTPVVVRDDLKTVIMKNVITVTLCLSINYINATLVYIFMKHEILKMNPRYILDIHLVINDIILMTLLTLIQVLLFQRASLTDG
ncbi:odorant receptor 131-2-like [Boleophthalmus pectinirostris]|uniref:odorant receptor 131-2-like n=1 Tax=Boleophthalmus pectinirostris TaxID=150288 RepID=UPI00242A4728|nr:odorant receptor 131-2-like [Boleophthalmus pectinirostris]